MLIILHVILLKVIKVIKGCDKALHHDQKAINADNSVRAQPCIQEQQCSTIVKKKTECSERSPPF